MSSPTTTEPSTSLPCAHCGTPFERGTGSGDCCSPACASVRQLIQAEGLDRFYRLKSGPVPPVSPTALSPSPPDADLEARLAEAETAAGSGGLARASLGLQGLACTGCVWLVGAVAGRHDGIARADADPARGSVDLAWVAGRGDARRFLGELRRLGYRASARPGEGDPSAGGDMTARLGLAAFLALNGMLFAFPTYFGMPADAPPATVFRTLSAAFGTASLVLGLSFFGRRALAAWRAGTTAFDLPVVIGLVVAWLGSLAGWWLGETDLMYFDFVSTFTFLMLVGRWLHDRAVDRHRRALGSGLAPGEVERRAGPGGPGGKVPVAALRAGDPYLLHPGCAIPVASRLEPGAGEVEVSLAGINGEPAARLWPAGRDLPAGAVLLGSVPAPLLALEGWDDSLYRGLLEAPPPADPAGRTAAAIPARLLRGWLALVLVAAAVAFAAWTRAGEPVRGLQAAVSLLVVSCPCAIGLAWPFADASANARLRRLGVYLRAPDLWGRLRRVRRVVFDKTGTLTHEAPRLARPAEIDRLDAAALGALARLVRDTLHPVGRAFREILAGRAVAMATGEVVETPGSGLELRAADGCTWRLGKPTWACPGGVHGNHGVLLARDGARVAAFTLDEELRPGAATTVSALVGRGIGVHVLSGDEPARAKALAGKAGIDPAAVEGGLSPADKARRLAELGAGTSLFLGDGANDGPASDLALVNGTPVADRGALTARSDFLLLHPGLGSLAALFAVADRRRRAIAAALGFAACYNVAAAALAAAGGMSPLLAAVLMPAASLVSLALAAR